MNLDYAFPSPTPPSLCVSFSRLLILVYGFLTAIGEDYPGGVDGDVWWGSAVVGTAMLIIVVVGMCWNWIRAWCQGEKDFTGVTVIM